MKHLKKLGLASALALVATCGVVGTASATTLDPANTAVTLSSSNSSLAVSGGGTVACTGSTITGNTGSTTATTVAIPAVLSYTGCTAFVLPATVTPAPACSTGTTQIKLDVMGLTSTTAVGQVTLPAGCTIDVNIAGISCTLTVTGGQTIGNGTTGAGGIDWTNASPKSSAIINSAAVAGIHSSGGGFGCPTAGVHTGTLTGTYAVSSATNVTVTP